MKKKLLVPERLRELPRQFSWIDQQLVRGDHLRDCDHRAWALYLFVASVSDSQGLSYYSEAALGQWLNLDPPALRAAREQLLAAGLLAYEKPLYQLLSLPNRTRTVPGRNWAPAVAATILSSSAFSRPMDKFMGWRREHTWLCCPTAAAAELVLPYAITTASWHSASSRISQAN